MASAIANCALLVCCPEIRVVYVAIKEGQVVLGGPRIIAVDAQVGNAARMRRYDIGAGPDITWSSILETLSRFGTAGKVDV